MPKLVFLHGPAASGKLTIAKELAAITSYKLFHNHLTVDMLLNVFPFGSPNFVKHRQRIWLDIIDDAMAEGIDVIFTFCPENTVDVNFPDLLREVVRNNHGTMVSIQVACPDDVLVQRMGTDSRRQLSKLVSGDFYLELKSKGAFDYPVIPSNMGIDSSVMEHKDAARLIADHLESL